MTAQRPPHDAFFKEVFSQVKAAEAEIEAMLPPELVAELDFSTAKLVPGSFVDEQLSERHSDLLWSVRLGGRQALLYVLLEHQSRPDPLMPYRLLRYMVRIWDRWLRDHAKAKRLPAVIPLVVYQGASSWRAPKQFADLIELPPVALSAVGKHLPRFELLLDDLSQRSESELRARQASPLGVIALLLLKAARERADMIALLDSMADLLQALRSEPRGFRSLELVVRYTLEVSDVSTMDLARLLASKVGIKEGQAVITTAERLREQGIERGLERGLEQGRRDVLLRQLRIRFGDLADEDVRRVESADSKRLDALTERVLTATSLGELFR